MKSEAMKIDPFIASLMPDSDKRMSAIASTSLLVALSLSLLASTYERVIDDYFFEKTAAEEMTATFKINDKKEEEKKIEKKEIEKREKIKKEIAEKNITKELNRRKKGGGEKQKGKGDPKAPSERGVLKLLTSLTSTASAEAYEGMKQKFAKDIEKVLNGATGLIQHGTSNIGAMRHGKINAGYNEGYGDAGPNGIGDQIGGLIGSHGGGAIKTKAMGKFKAPTLRDIDMGTGGGSRSASDIMKVVRQRTPGLRHVYNTYLKKKPGFQGKVTLRFVIAPGGDVISNAIVSSTTGFAEFDNAIKKAVSSWTFNKVKSGNTTVTIPFTFSE
ncbi:MAG: TonB family protein [Candidatus Saccharibacteria bacterium]|nr:TonB family protein [Candidatus Saccharibacteria bacterium]